MPVILVFYRICHTVANDFVRSVGNILGRIHSKGTSGNEHVMAFSVQRRYFTAGNRSKALFPHYHLRDLTATHNARTAGLQRSFQDAALQQQSTS